MKRHFGGGCDFERRIFFARFTLIIFSHILIAYNGEERVMFAIVEEKSQAGWVKEDRMTWTAAEK